MSIQIYGHKGPYFVMLIGLPGVGKSTFRQDVDDAVVLSTDDWVEARAAEQGVTYDTIWERDIGEATAALQADLRAAIKARENIILDRTNLSAKKRRGFLAQLPADYYKLALVFETPGDEEYARRLDRPGKKIPDRVIGSMRIMMDAQPVRHDEGWHCIKEIKA